MPSTVDRVLPWRRSERPPADEVAPLLAAALAPNPIEGFVRRWLLARQRRRWIVAIERPVAQHK